MAEPRSPGPFLARLGRSFTGQFFLLAFLPLAALLLAVTFGSLSLHHDGMRSLVADRNWRAVQAAAEAIDKEIHHQGELVSVAALSAGAGNQDALANSIPSLSGGLALYAPDLQLLGSSEVAGSWAASLASDFRFLLQDLADRAGGEAVFSNAVELSGAHRVFVAARTAAGELLVGSFDAGTIIQHGLSWVTAPVVVTVVDRSAQPLYGGENLLLYEQEIEAGLQGRGGIRYSEHHATEQVVAYSPVQPLGWVLVVEEPWGEIASPLLTATQYAPLILLPVLLLALVSLWLGLRQIVQPLIRLESQAKDLADGDFTALQQSVGGIPEIRSLQTTLRDTAGKLRQAQDNLHGYIGALTAGVEQERRNLARELHDDTLQALIALNQRLQLARMQKDGANGWQEVQALLDATMQNLRRTVRGMRPIYLEDLGLSAALEMLADESGASGGLPVQFERRGPERRLSPETELALYRIAQEALSNASRHSGAQRASLRLTFEPAGVTLEIEDDGRGFSPPARPDQFARKGHYGLLSIQERADLVGAQVEIQSAPGEGTRIRVTCPAVEPA